MDHSIEATMQVQNFRFQPLLCLTVSVVLAQTLFATGCHQNSTKAKSNPPVTVAHPEMRDVTLYQYFTGRVEAIDSVDVRSRVSGYLNKINFKSGSEVRSGDVLFIVDQRPFQAQVDEQSATLDQAKAQQKLAHIQYQRDIGLQQKDPGAIAQVSVDKSTANVGVQDANVLQAAAQLQEAQLNLDYCSVSAPITGVVSRNLVSIGNLITGGSEQATLLTTIVSVDPMYAYFDVDEHTIERIEKSIREGKRPPIESKKIPVELGLSVDQGKYPHKGYVDYTNNQFTSDTGTLQVRGVFSNPKPKDGHRVLIAGQFVKIRVPISTGPQLLINADAVGQDIVGPYVVVIDGDQKAHYQYVELGQEIEGMQVINKGLSTTDWVVIDGQHNARPGGVVDMHEQGTSKKTADTAENTSGTSKNSHTSGETGN